MAVTSYDVQLCLWKILKLWSKTCLAVSLQHPYTSSSLILLFFLYICFPLVFWILIYSLPLIVCTCIFLTISFSHGSTENEERERRENLSKKSSEECCDQDHESSKKPYNRVHSVRRRRAKDIVIEQVQEEKNSVSPTDFSPKEIREVHEVTSSSDNLKQENEQLGFNQIRRLGILQDEEEDDHQKETRIGVDDRKSTMEVGILDAERNKRLESLIARRRSRKLLSLQVKRSLINMDHHSQIASLMIPKINTTYSPSKMGSPFSPGPGSAPSVLIPMRNPFDLPYDPQEEKLDLTGDSFNQEFTSFNNRDLVFCRHGSFSSGPSLPSDFFQDRDQTTSVRNFGFRQRGFSTGFRFSNLRNKSADMNFSPIIEQEPYEPSESKPKSNSNSPNHDEIKEIIQVHENDTRDHSEQECSDSQGESGQIPQSDFNYSSTSRSPSSSSEEDRPVFKIDREAILKSLSSMRRNALLEIDNSDRFGETNNLSYANSALENASRLKQQYYADKPTRKHGVSCSIASDMQVEVSEVSSPPLTIDENMSYEGEIERNASWDGDDMWGPARPSEAPDHDSRSGEADGEQDPINGEDNRSLQSSIDELHCVESKSSEETIEAPTTEDEQIRSGEASAIDLNDSSHQEQSLRPNVQGSVISPKSVLVPTLSLSSIEREEGSQSEPHIGEVSTPVELQVSTGVIEQTRDLLSSNGDGESSDITERSSIQNAEESTEPANASTESVSEKLKAQENEEQPEEVDGDDNSELVRVHEETEQRKEESRDLEAADSVDFSQNTDHLDEEELSKNEKSVVGEPKHDDSSNTNDLKDEAQNPSLHEEMGHDERPTSSTTSNVFEGTKDELVHLNFDAACEPPVALSEPVEENDNPKSCKKNEGEQ